MVGCIRQRLLLCASDKRKAPVDGFVINCCVKNGWEVFVSFCEGGTGEDVEFVIIIWAGVDGYPAVLPMREIFGRKVTPCNLSKKKKKKSKQIRYIRSMDFIAYDSKTLHFPNLALIHCIGRTDDIP